jgi:sugar/nucleoside kinase (ribokinase family)
LNFETIKQRVGLAEMAALLDDNRLIGFENWALPPYSGQIWQGIYDYVLPLMKSDMRGKTLFFDLADPASRQESELKSALETISAFAKHFQVILGLNLREAVQVACLFGGAFDTADCDLEAVARYIRDFVEVQTLVIHPVRESCCLVDGHFFHKTGPFCAKPKLTTGAGDNFNAGFVLGMSIGLKPDEALLLGMATSGFYVRQSRSGSFEELKDFLGRWAQKK